MHTISQMEMGADPRRGRRRIRGAGASLVWNHRWTRMHTDGVAEMAVAREETGLGMVHACSGLQGYAGESVDVEDPRRSDLCSSVFIRGSNSGGHGVWVTGTIGGADPRRGRLRIRGAGALLVLEPQMDTDAHRWCRGDGGGEGVDRVGDGARVQRLAGLRRRVGRC